MLCFRCEFRAQHLEGKYSLRAECKDIYNSKISCYAFKPCKEIIFEEQIANKRRYQIAVRLKENNNE